MKIKYKNVPVPEAKHAILKNEAWKRKLSLSKFISAYADSLKGKKLT